MGSPLERDKKLCEYLGKVTARWGMFDEALCLLLGDFLNSESIGRSIYFSSGSFRQRVETIKAAAAARIVHHEDNENFIKLLNKIYKTFQVRNKLIHAHYVIVVKDDKGAISYINQYLDDEISLENGKLEPLYIGRIDDKSEEGVSRVNAGTFSNHGEKVSDLMYQILEVREHIESGVIETERF